MSYFREEKHNATNRSRERINKRRNADWRPTTTGSGLIAIARQRNFKRRIEPTPEYLSDLSLGKQSNTHGDGGVTRDVKGR